MSVKVSCTLVALRSCVARAVAMRMRSEAKHRESSSHRPIFIKDDAKDLLR